MDLAVGAGEWLTVLGPSGSGKSTLLRLIAGLERPSSGTIALDGKPADSLAPRDRDAAMVFQQPATYPHLNVFDNLAFGLRARGVSGGKLRERVEAVAGQLGLGALLGRMPRALSGGERQRVALGRAIARRPKLLLLDEPFSSLDPPLRAAIRADLIDLRRGLDATLILVTHDQGEALALGDRVAVLDRGKLEQVGTPSALYDRPASRFVAGFVGSPPMNLLPGRIAAEPPPRFAIAGTEIALPVGPGHPSLRPGPAVLGLRPEAIAVAPPGSPDLVATVRRLEPTGHETIATLDLGPHSLRLRLPRGADVAPDEVLPLRLDLAAAAWFDGESGKRLATEATEEEERESFIKF
ncbi:MAG TPA: ABC transporter ATP-binding protein [Isosphaeraceae bacterium]|nr:ABC transporter ATP-binding protein [Isosphaeraceae bacterium]